MPRVAPAVRFFGWLSLVIALVVGGCGTHGAPPAIGVILSGRFTEATRMALEDARAADPALQVEAHFQNEATQESTAAIARAESLITLPGLLAVVGHSNSAASIAAAPVYAAHNLVMLAPTSTATTFSAAGGFAFRLVPPDDAQGDFLVRGVDSLYPSGARVAVWYVNDEYGRGLRNAFMMAADSARLHVVFDAPHSDVEIQTLPRSELDSRTEEMVRSMAERAPDVLVWLGRPTRLDLSLASIRAVFPAIPIFGGDALAGRSETGPRHPEWAGIRYVDFFDPNGTPALREFRDRFRGRDSLGSGTPEVLSYDAMRMILRAIADGASTGPEIRDWLHSLGRTRAVYQGLSGPIAFDAVGDVQRSYILRQFPTVP